MLLLLELSGIIFAVLIICGNAAQAPRPTRSLADAALVSTSAWAAEESCILLYRFYEYSPGWHLVLDEVPLLVVVIWPVLIFSAGDLTSHLRATHPGKGVLAGAAVVATDALFIEPLCVAAGLWRWELPGLFHVPPIGILGWFYFALMNMRLLDESRMAPPPSWSDLPLLFLPAIGTHLLLLLTWWGALRWINFPLPAPAVAGAAWCVSFLMVAAIYKNQTGRKINKKTLLLRIPAALFFFALLIFKAPDSFFLAAYALAFVPPYVLLMVLQYRRHAA